MGLCPGPRLQVRPRPYPRPNRNRSRYPPTQGRRIRRSLIGPIRMPPAGIRHPLLPPEKKRPPLGITRPPLGITRPPLGKQCPRTTKNSPGRQGTPTLPHPRWGRRTPADRGTPPYRTLAGEGAPWPIEEPQPGSTLAGEGAPRPAGATPTLPHPPGKAHTGR